MVFIKMKASEVRELAIKRHEGYNRFVDKYVEEAMNYPHASKQDSKRQAENYVAPYQIKIGHIINLCDARPEDDLYISDDTFKMLTEKQLWRGEEI